MGVGNAVYFRLCIDFTAEEYDGTHHPKYAECVRTYVEGRSVTGL